MCKIIGLLLLSRPYTVLSLGTEHKQFTRFNGQLYTLSILSHTHTLHYKHTHTQIHTYIHRHIKTFIIPRIYAFEPSRYMLSGLVWRTRPRRRWRLCRLFSITIFYLCFTKFELLRTLFSRRCFRAPVAPGVTLREPARPFTKSTRQKSTATTRSSVYPPRTHRRTSRSHRSFGAYFSFPLFFFIPSEWRDRITATVIGHSFGSVLYPGLEP